HYKAPARQPAAGPEIALSVTVSDVPQATDLRGVPTSTYHDAPASGSVTVRMSGPASHTHVWDWQPEMSEPVIHVPGQFLEPASQAIIPVGFEKPDMGREQDNCTVTDPPCPFHGFAVVYTYLDHPRVSPPPPAG